MTLSDIKKFVYRYVNVYRTNVFDSSYSSMINILSTIDRKTPTQQVSKS